MYKSVQPSEGVAPHAGYSPMSGGVRVRCAGSAEIEGQANFAGGCRGTAEQNWRERSRPALGDIIVAWFFPKHFGFAVRGLTQHRGELTSKCRNCRTRTRGHGVQYCRNPIEYGSGHFCSDHLMT
jgi:hypothetical protein